jgi:ribonuclease HII
MQIVAGIDEAGYGPKFGPLTAGRCVLASHDAKDTSPVPDLWARLDGAVSQKPRDPQKRIAVADSKRLTVSGKHGHATVPHLERAVLTFMTLHDGRVDLPCEVLAMLERLDSRHHRREDLPPWYAVDDSSSEQVPVATTAVAGRNGHDADAIRLDAGLLRRAARHAGVHAPGGEPCLGVAVLCEDQYNRRLAGAASKADVAFALIAHHLRRIWDRHAPHHPRVFVDRQGGRTRYRQRLGETFPEADIHVHEEHAEASEYDLQTSDGRTMAVRFEPKADDNHLPVALASMTAKYVRELYMHRFQRWFAERRPDVRPTAGYGTNANRFAAEIRPHLPSLGIDPAVLIRRA